jgi:NAD-dependent SIR2 family protein deacetylase
VNRDATIRAADLIDSADALLIAAGAGMGVDSGLPDFRGPEGFWRAYPALGRRGIEFHRVASPQTFESDPALAWGFYGHRLNLYRDTVPHAGFGILKAWGERMLQGYGVFTSNVDGHFGIAGFDRRPVTECHGSIHHLQCSVPCGTAIWSANNFTPVVDAAECLLLSEFPRCLRCGALARPNILMFSDDAWLEARSMQQQAALGGWLDQVERLVVVEVGAGTAIPSVRHFTHRLIIDFGARLIRINLREPAVPSNDHVAFAGAAQASLLAIESELSRRR